MDYSKLAEEFLEQMHKFSRLKPQQKLTESMHGEAMALHHIAKSSEQIIPSEISSAIGISGARIAATLNSLENKGYITRRIDLSDRRRILVTLTEKGREQDETHRRQLSEIFEKILEKLGEHDAKEYIRITRKMAELFQQEDKECSERLNT